MQVFTVIKKKNNTQTKVLEMKLFVAFVGESDADAIDYEKYLMEKVYLKDLVHNPDDTVVSCMSGTFNLD